MASYKINKEKTEHSNTSGIGQCFCTADAWLNFSNFSLSYIIVLYYSCLFLFLNFSQFIPSSKKKKKYQLTPFFNINVKAFKYHVACCPCHFGVKHRPRVCSVALTIVIFLLSKLSNIWTRKTFFQKCQQLNGRRSEFSTWHQKALTFYEFSVFHEGDRHVTTHDGLVGT